MIDKNSIYTGFNEDGIPGNEWRAFVDEETDYYIKKWSSAKNLNRFAGWNWAAFGGGFFWLGYHKMYKEMYWICLFMILITAIGISLKWNYNSYQNTLLEIFLGLYGNVLYYKFCAREIKKIKAESASDNIEKELRIRGGGSGKGILIAFLFIAAYMGVYYYLLENFMFKIDV